MRKILSFLLASCMTLSAFSQWSVSAGGNYTHFKGPELMNLNTPGFHSRIMYEKGLYGIGLTYNHHSSFHTQNSIPLSTPPNSPDWPSVATEINHRFQTLDLSIRRTIFGNQQSRGQFYGGVGASFVMLSYEEKYTESYTLQPMFDPVKGKGSGFTANGFMGGELKVGRIALYGEASYSLPKSVWPIKDGYYISPSRVGFQLGIKLPLNR